MRIALAQLDARLGDLEANRTSAGAAAAEAAAEGADLLVLPELYLSGYALAATERETAMAVDEAAGAVGDLSALVCFHERDGDERYNSAVYVEDGAAVHVQRKVYLPDYAPFDEHALFTAGDAVRAFDTALGRMAVLICNDAWQPFLPSFAAQAGAEMLLVPAASSTAVPEAEAYWRELTGFYARMLECYVVFVNRVGRDAGFTFWGGSHVVDPLGEVVAEAPRLEESLLVVDVDLERVSARRRELPLLGELRPELLRAELERVTEGAGA
jgi:predicted amidohydrolase